MSMPPANNETDADRESSKQADAMKDRLRKDVASWSAARSATYNRDTAMPPPPSAPATQQPARAKRSKQAAQTSGNTIAAAKKPFRMSYDGVTEADYISYIIERGN
jgi:hypothetical protein